MRNKVTGIVLSFAIIGFVLMFRGSDGFSSLFGAGGGGGASIEAQNNGVSVVPTVVAINCDGSTITCADGGLGVVDISVITPTPGSGGAPNDSQYVVIANDGTLTDERALTGTASQITVTDNGAGSTVVLSLPQNIATTSSPTFASMLLTGQLNLLSGISEFITVNAPATINISTRDNVIVNLDTNNNSASDFCLRSNGVAADVFCIDESGIITLATIDGDNNTLVDVKPDSFDSVDAGADEECLTYEGTNTVEWQACSTGGTLVQVDYPVESGGSPSTTIYVGLPGTSFSSSGGAFVTANDIYLMPFYTSKDITIVTAYFEVTSAGNPGDACRLGVYPDAGDRQPGTLTADWGQVVNDSTGWKNTGAISTAISAGNYLIAMLCNSGPALRGYAGVGSALTAGVANNTTSGTRFVNLMRVGTPSGTQYASGFAATGDQWDTVDLSTGGFNYGHYVLLQWTD